MKPGSRVWRSLLILGLPVCLLLLSVSAAPGTTFWIADRLRDIKVAFDAFPEGWSTQWEGDAVQDGRGGLLAEGKSILRVFDQDGQERGSYVGLFKAGYAQDQMRLILKDPKVQSLPGLSLSAIPGETVGPKSGQDPNTGGSGCNQTGVLANIELYRAPPFPVRTINVGGKKITIESRDTYDSRLKGNLPVPSTITDCLVTDIWQRLTKDLKLQDIQPYQLSREQVDKALGIYMTRNWDQIAGLRPWAHWHFIRQLSPEERENLACEILHAFKTKRVWDEKN